MNGRLLTLFVLPVDRACPSRQSFFDKWPSLDNVYFCSDNDSLGVIPVETPFFAYCYANEEPDFMLKQAMNFHLKLLGWDFLVLYRRVRQDDGEFKYFRAPRVFRKSVRMKGLLPDPAHVNYQNLHVLEGFLV